MNKFLKLTQALMLMILAAGVLTSCKKDFDQPPAYIEPNITANATIADLKALYPGTGYYTITDDIIVEGVVVADDRSGNYYKSIVIQDATGGIQLNLDGTNLYTDYPIGRRIFLKAKGLILGNYARLIQIGAYIDNSNPTSPSLGGIPYSVFNNYIVKASLNNPITPIPVTIGQLNDSYQNMLIKLDLMTFAANDVNRPYADAVNRVSLNRTINDMSGGAIIIRTSGYADFANALTPSGYGSVTAIYTVFNSTKQLVLRDSNDVQMGQPAPTAHFSQDFESVTVNANVNLAGWGNYAQNGSVLYQGKSFSGNKFAQITAFGSNQATVTSWLVSPAINLATIPEANKSLVFKTIDGFNNGSTFKAMISTDYAGGNTPWTATWTELPATISCCTASGYAANFTGSGFISLNNYSGNVYIAFVYSGNDPSGTANDHTTTYQLDDVKVYGY